MIPKLIAFTAAAAACALVAWKTSGARGLTGAAVGAGAGLVIALVSDVCTRWAQRAEGQRVYLAMLASMLGSLAIVVAVVLVLSRYWAEILQSAAVTMVVVYLAFRFVAVLRIPKGARDTETGPQRGRLQRGSPESVGPESVGPAGDRSGGSGRGRRAP